MPGLLISLLIFSACLSLKAQVIDPVQSIRELKEGYLVIRFPGYKMKIDTLTAMLARSDDLKNSNRLQKLLNEAIEKRDSVREDYTNAFQNVYDFSKVAYFFDYEAKDLPNAHFYHPDGSSARWADLTEYPLHFLHFERTVESKIDALVIYHMNGEIVPHPFPNKFTQGGFSFLFVKIADKSFPAWRVNKMNKRLHKFWEEVN